MGRGGQEDLNPILADVRDSDPYSGDQERRVAVEGLAILDKAKQLNDDPSRFVSVCWWESNTGNPKHAAEKAASLEGALSLEPRVLAVIATYDERSIKAMGLVESPAGWRELIAECREIKDRVRARWHPGTGMTLRGGLPSFPPQKRGTSEDPLATASNSNARS